MQANVSAHDDIVRRRTMVDCQLRTFDITDHAILDAFETVPRELFVAGADPAVAYSDATMHVVADGVKRAMLAPMVLARMLQGASARATDRALVVGGAFGYSAAILARLVASVTSLDTASGFATVANGIFSSLGVKNATAVVGPLEKGWAAASPYDLILVDGAVEDGLEPLLEQLATGGRLVVITREPDHSGRSARAKLFERLNTGGIGDRWLFDAAGETLEAFRKRPLFVF